MTSHDEHRPHPLVEKLPRSIEPAHDLWPGIEARMAERRGWSGRPRRRVIVLAAAAGIAIALASSAVTAWLVRSGDGSPAAVGVSAPGAREAAYLRATAVLTQELATRRDELAPETVEVLERNLAIIDAAIAESRAALARDPANDTLAELLWASYEQKVSLLEQAARLTTSS